MAKKSRRARRKGDRPKLSAAQMVRPGMSEAAVEARVTEAASSEPAPAADQGPDLRGEYRYVINDLKRIAIIAASMVALLVILAFVLI